MTFEGQARGRLGHRFFHAKDTVYAHFRGWSERNGVSPLTAKAFWERLRQLGDVVDGRKRSNGGQIRVCNVVLEPR